MVDEEKVWFQDRYLLWSEFKARFPSWDFHYPIYYETGLDNVSTRIAHSWEAVGQELCEGYGIQYTITDQSFSERAKHFIFLVGATEGMRKNWQYFIRAAKAFAETKTTQDPYVTHFSSCIGFSHRAKIAFRDVPLSDENFDSENLQALFSFSEDKTLFSAALGSVIELLEKQTSRMPAVIILVSDGDEAFPQKELKRLCEDQIWKKIDSFWALAFGNRARHGTVMGMAQWMVKGYREKWHFKNPKDYTELVSHYEQIANET